MAILRVYQKIENDVYKLTFVNDPIELSDTDKKLMQRFGEPEIEMGGVYLDGDADEFTIPTVKAKIRSDFPYTAEFDSKSSPFDENTEIKVLAYRDDIKDRFTAALIALRETTDTFTGENTYTV